MTYELGDGWYMILFMYGIVYSVHFHSFKGLLAQGSDYSSGRAGLSIRVFVIRSRSELGQGVIKKFGL